MRVVGSQIVSYVLNNISKFMGIVGYKFLNSLFIEKVQEPTMPLKY